MTKIRIVLYSVFGLYQLTAFAFTAYLDANKNDWGLLTQMLAKIPLFKYGTLIGLVLISIDFFLSLQSSRKSSKTIEELKHEVNALKAAAYDQTAKR